MLVSLTLIRYSKWGMPMALLAMALHRIPLFFNPKIKFWKLMGCGKNGTFDLNPDWQQWGLLAVWDSEADFNSFYSDSLISKWWKWFAREQWTVLAEPLSSHGKWAGKEPFGNPKQDEGFTEPVAVLTRASIRFTKLRSFWRNVPAVSQIMAQAPGYIYSVGIGESPFVLQATFSIWNSLDDVKAFAYRSVEHSEVIRKTRKENWYSEELFARFRLIKTIGRIQGQNPLAKLNILHEN